MWQPRSSPRANAATVRAVQRRSLAWVFLLVVVAACRCGQGVTDVPEAPLVVTPTALDFGVAFVGQRVTRVLLLRNPSVRQRALAVEVPAPFEASFAPTLAGGASLEVPLSVTVAASGVVDRVVEVDGTAVSLRIEGRAVPACEASGPCREAYFDLTSGACQERPSSDDTTCTTSCLAAGRCVGGECLGQAQACDDQDLCTVDACGGAGCVHVPVRCAPPSPCQTARCDPTQGCVFEPIVDGVSCGADDCARDLAFVCIDGQCVDRPRPEGSLCVETLAGFSAGPGHVDGTGDTVRFDTLLAGATDAWGTTWLVSRFSLRKLTPGGVVSTVLRRANTTEQFLPHLAVTDALGNLYFDEGRCVRRVTPLGDLTLLGASCSTLGSTGIESILPLRDGRVLIAWQQALFAFDSAGQLQRVATGRGPLQETSAGELLFVSVDDGGTTLSALQRDGGVRALRPWKGLFTADPQERPAPAVSAQGRALSPQEDDGGCVVSVEAPDGSEVLRHPTHTSCFVAGSTLARTGGWIGRDESVWLLDQSLQVSRLDGGVAVRLLGFTERPGDADGRGADAGLRVTGDTYALDLLAERAPGVLSLVDAQLGAVSRLREWRDDTGLVTRSDGGLQFRIASLQGSDGGLWLFGADGARPDWTWWDGVGAPSFAPSTLPPYELSFLPRVALRDDEGTWFLVPELARCDAAHRCLGTISGGASTDFPNDGPLAPFLPDAGVSFPSASEAHFGAISAAASLPDGRLVLAAGNVVRLMADGGLVTLAGQRDGGFADGRGAQAAFDRVTGIGWSPTRQLLFVADFGNFAIRSVALSGEVRTVAKLSDRPVALTVTESGDVYVLVKHALLRAR